MLDPVSQRCVDTDPSFCQGVVRTTAQTVGAQMNRLLHGDRLVAEDIGVSLITLGKIYEGIYYGRDPKWSETGFRQFLTAVRVLPLTRPVVQLPLSFHYR
jgi:predicted nucleic acid-binding protein